MDAEFDVVVLGAGSGGYACALRAAELGLSVALVEQDKVGGTCLHRGCIPTKAWLHAAEIADGAKAANQFGVRASLDGVDAAGVAAYADQVVQRLYQGLTGLIGGRGIETIAGSGVLERTDSGVAVRVGDRLVRGRATVLATGSMPRTLSGAEPDGDLIMDSDQLLATESIPDSLVVLGGGVIGVEFASAYASFGTKVTVIEGQDRLLPAEEPESSKALARAFRRRQIDIITGQAVTGVRTENGAVVVSLTGGREVSADRLLVAIGRAPVTDGMGFDEAGITRDRGFVVTDERLATTIAGVYALGDIVAGPQLAHRGFAQGIFLAEQLAHQRGLLADAPAVIVDSDIPRVTYSQPEVAAVGLGEAAARAAGEIETMSYELSGNGRSQILKTSGFVKIIRRTDGPVLGIHLVGDRVGELIGEAQLITGWEAFPEDVAALLHAHPTQSEAIGEAHLALAGKPLHVHG